MTSYSNPNDNNNLSALKFRAGQEIIQVGKTYYYQIHQLGPYLHLHYQFKSFVVWTSPLITVSSDF